MTLVTRTEYEVEEEHLSRCHRVLFELYLFQHRTIRTVKPNSVQPASKK